VTAHCGTKVTSVVNRLMIIEDGLRCGFVQFCTTGSRDPHEAVGPIVWVNVEPHDDASRRNA
jgi:hypothetical protein